MNIHFLGTGSAYPGKSRDNTSICFSTDKNKVLVDVSGNPCRKLKEVNIHSSEIDSVILTHFHIDHIYGLPSLLWGMWLEGRQKPLHIYCDASFENQLNDWLETIKINEWKIEFSIIINTFDYNQNQLLIADETLKINSFPAIHSIPTIGLEIHYNNKFVIYSSDTEINNLIFNYDHIDILIHEATFAIKQQNFHSSLLEVVEKYNLSNIDKVILIHLSENEPYKEVLNDLSEDIFNKCSLAQEMETIYL